jgi:hypothetical protein
MARVIFAAAAASLGAFAAVASLAAFAAVVGGRVVGHGFRPQKVGKYRAALDWLKPQQNLALQVKPSAAEAAGGASFRTVPPA